jgi:MFS family permease
MQADNRSTVSYFDKSVLPWIICTIGMLFYCYNYFLRVSPSVMKDDLMQNLHITAYQFGNLAAFYYYAYTPMQIPVGMIYDRFGARIVLFFACLAAVLGVGLFISADTLAAASAGRFLIGLGTAFAYIGVLKIASLWLEPKRFAMIAGLTTAFGMASAIFSDLYLTKFVQLLGYKNALYTSLIVGVVLSVFILIFMKSKPQKACSQLGAEKPNMTFRQLLHALKIIFKNPQMWLIGIIGCLFYMPATVFLDLWGIPFLRTAYHLDKHTAAMLVCTTFVGWIIAGPSIGAFSDYIQRRCVPLVVSAIMAAILLSTVFYVRDIPLNYLYVIFFFIGIFCGAHPLCFALGKDNNANQISGMAVAFTNTLIMVGGAIFQPVVGLLLDWHTTAVSVNGAPVVFTPGDYIYALSVVPIGLVIAIGLTFFLKETYCQSKETIEERPKAQVFKLQPRTQS